jgi:hypothetical protein
MNKEYRARFVMDKNLMVVLSAVALAALVAVPANAKSRTHTEQTAPTLAIKSPFPYRPDRAEGRNNAVIASTLPLGAAHRTGRASHCRVETADSGDRSSGGDEQPARIAGATANGDCRPRPPRHQRSRPLVRVRIHAARYPNRSEAYRRWRCCHRLTARPHCIRDLRDPILLSPIPMRLSRRYGAG